MLDRSAGATSRQPGAANQPAWGPAAFILIPALSVVWKLILLGMNAFPFHSDEAVVALMARHILQGEIPFFFYGQAYLGSLDALLIAAGFALFGEHVLVVRLVQAALYSATVATTMLLVHRWRSDWPTTIFAGILMAFPAVNVTLYTTVSLGGYGEALLIGNLLVLLALNHRERPDRTMILVTWGVLAGLGWWAFGLTLVYIVPTACLVGVSILQANGRRWTRAAFGLAAFCLGSLPWFAGLWQEGLGTGIQEVTGSAIAGASSEIWYIAIFEHARNFLVFAPTVVLGFRAPWSAEILHPAPAILIGSLWLMAFVTLAKRASRSGPLSTFAVLWLAVAGSLIGGFVLSSFGADPTGRYFLPLTVPLSMLGASFLALVVRRWNWWAGAVGLLLLVGFNVLVTFQLAREKAPGLTTQFAAAARVDHSRIGELIEFLLEHEERRGYTNYWIAYPLAFQSGEELLYVPQLPYHHDFRFAERDSRYQPYELAVAAADQAAYITANHARLNDELERGLSQLDISYQIEEIGPYTIFYDLSRKVHPSELDLPDGR